MSLLLVLLPLYAAILSLLGIAPKRSSIICSVITLGLTALFSVTYMDKPEVLDYSIPILADLNINLSLGYMDGMSVVLVLLTAIVGLAATMSGKCPEGKERLWFSSINFIIAGGMGAFLSKDLFFFYAFHELALIPTFLMIGMLGRGDRRGVAWRTTIFLALGSIVLLAGLLWLVSASGTGSFSFTELLATQITGPEAKGIALLLLIGFGVLVSLFPLHSWAAPAYASAPSPIAMLHAGVLKKFGLYGLFRLYPVVSEGFQPWLTLLVVLLLFNIIWMGFVTINQKRLDDMLGNSSVMHMGYIFLAFAALVASGGENPIAKPAATLLMFGHGVSVALLFHLVDVIDRRSRSLDVRDLGGIASVSPKLAFWFGLGAMASIGLPGLANFAGEVMVFISGFHGWSWGEKLGIIQIATIISISGVVISAVYMLRALGAAFHGEQGRKTREVTDITAYETWPAVFLAVALLFIGIAPNTFLKLDQPAKNVATLAHHTESDHQEEDSLHTSENGKRSQPLSAETALITE